MSLLSFVGSYKPRMSISSTWSGIICVFFFFMMNNRVPGAPGIRGKLTNLRLTMLTRTVFGPVSSRHSWGRDLVVDPQVDMKSSQLTFLCEQNFWQKLTHCNFKGNYYFLFGRQKILCLSGCSLWKVTGLPTETSFLVILHVDGNLRARQACGQIGPLLEKEDVAPASHRGTLQTVGLTRWHKGRMSLEKPFSWRGNGRSVSMAGGRLNRRKTLRGQVISPKRRYSEKVC